jgi:hypothetical protein
MARPLHGAQRASSIKLSDPRELDSELIVDLSLSWSIHFPGSDAVRPGQAVRSQLLQERIGNLRPCRRPPGQLAYLGREDEETVGFFVALDDA